MKKIDYENDNELIEGVNYFVNWEPSECLVCKHFIEDNFTCKAFPDKIPDEVYHGGKHYKKHPLQKGEFIFEITNELKEMYDMFYDENHNRRPEAGSLAFEYKPPIYFNSKEQ
jgi:hypothetical protein